MTTTDNIFWGDSGLKHLNILFQKDNLHNFYPKKGMTRAQWFNSLSRLIIYLTIILTLVQADIYYLIYGLLILVGLYIWNHKSKGKFDSQTQKSNNNSKRLVENTFTSSNYKGYREKKCYPQKYVSPTKENPFMNVLPLQHNNNDITQVSVVDDVSKNQEVVNQEIDDKFQQGLFREVHDVYGRANSQRQFYTMPNTSIVNDREGFVDWLYQTGPTCKEGNGLQCEKNDSPRIIGNLSGTC